MADTAQRLERYSRYQTLRLDFPSQHILRITISDPATRNAVSGDMHRDLAAIWTAVDDDDPQVRAVIVTGAGDVFSAGGDFALMEQIIEDYDARAVHA